MAEEFIMPVKYDGDNCGVSVSIFGLNDDCTYEKILISLEEEEYEVAITDEMQTTVATFNNLTENQYYTIIAKIISGDTVKVMKCRVVPSVAKSIQSTALTHRGFGGLPMPAARCHGKAL